MTTPPVKTLIDEQLDDIERRIAILGFGLPFNEVDRSQARGSGRQPPAAPVGDHERRTNRSEGSAMNLLYWILVVILVAGAGAYGIVKDGSGTCQVPRSTTYQVFR